MKKIKGNILEWTLAVVLAILFIFFQSAFQQVFTSSNIRFKNILVGEIIVISIVILVNFLLYLKDESNFVWDNIEDNEMLSAAKKPYKIINILFISVSLIWIITQIIFYKEIMELDNYFFLSFNPIVFSAILILFNTSFINEKF